MLGKLMKYEFKATSRFMLLMFGLLIALSSLMSVGIRLNLDDALHGIGDKFNFGALIFAVLVFIVIALFIVLNVVVLCGMFFFAVSRFKKNLLDNEGYLMHTLPVKTRDNILSKTFVSVIWTILGVVAALIAYFILFIGISNTNVSKELFELILRTDVSFANVRDILLISAEFALAGIVFLINCYFHIYASMAVGYSFNTHRAAKSIGVFILLSIASNILEVFAVGLLSMFGFSALEIESNVHAVLWLGIVTTSISSAICYIITNYFMSRRLNLQ